MDVGFGVRELVLASLGGFMISRAGYCGRKYTKPVFFAYLHPLFCNAFCYDICCARFWESVG